MIKVLTSWDEIAQANLFLGRNNLPKHRSAEKNWDLYRLYQLINPLSRDAQIIDLGCCGLDTLKFLQNLSFQNLIGVDLNIPLLDRLWQIHRMWDQKTLKKPFRLYRKDLTHTGLPAGIFDLATCISVIEHGVDFERFLQESARLLKPGGILFVTADYWQEPIDTSDVAGQFGLTWNILSQIDIERIIQLADQNHLQPLEHGLLPSCQDKCAVWNHKEYTFICLAFRKNR
jgi:SAM-dependent methyltransferase